MTNRGFSVFINRTSIDLMLDSRFNQFALHQREMSNYEARFVTVRARHSETGNKFRATLKTRNLNSLTRLEWIAAN